MKREGGGYSGLTVEAGEGRIGQALDCVEAKF